MISGPSSSARRANRSAEPAKSPRRRSPLPFVVRLAAFVSPKPRSSISHCSSGTRRRGVRSASARSRQKSLRGLAKWAPAAAERKPGLIPQKTTRRPGARTSGTSDSATALLYDEGQREEEMAQAETAVRTIKNYIGGGWVDAETSESLDVTNPATGETLAQVPMSSQADLDRAVAAARQAFPEWRATSPVERARAC